MPGAATPTGRKKRRKASHEKQTTSCEKLVEPHCYNAPCPWMRAVLASIALCTHGCACRPMGDRNAAGDLTPSMAESMRMWRMCSSRFDCHEN
jgi:hypothetical protein